VQDQLHVEESRKNIPKIAVPRPSR
jgi:hypothetical protein